MFHTHFPDRGTWRRLQPTSAYFALGAFFLVAGALLDVGALTLIGGGVLAASLFYARDLLRPHRAGPSSG
jgi:hypothetical protein